MKKRSSGASSILAFFCVTLLITAMPAWAEGEFDFIEPAQTTVTPDTLDHTGAAITRIPIEVPPGRKGIQPGLAMVYSSLDATVDRRATQRCHGAETAPGCGGEARTTAAAMPASVETGVPRK